MVAALLDLGFDAREKHKDGYSPLHRACQGREAKHAEVRHAGSRC